MACLRRFWGLSYVWASLPATPFVGPPGAFLGAKKAPTAADAVFLKITATSRPCSGAVPPQTRLKSGLFHTCPRQSRPFPHFSDMLSPYTHFAEKEKRSYPKEDKEIYRTFIERLKANGYEGRISMEAGVQTDFETEAKAALELFRTY